MPGICSSRALCPNLSQNVYEDITLGDTAPGNLCLKYFLGVCVITRQIIMSLLEFSRLYFQHKMLTQIAIAEM
jgi:hypothetical protein